LRDDFRIHQHEVGIRFVTRISATAPASSWRMDRALQGASLEATVEE
jgi:hypothetical protein